LIEIYEDVADDASLYCFRHFHWHLLNDTSRRGQYTDIGAAFKGFLVTTSQGPGSILTNAPIIPSRIGPSQNAVNAVEISGKFYGYWDIAGGCVDAVFLVSIDKIQGILVETIFRLAAVFIYVADVEPEISQMICCNLNTNFCLGNAGIALHDHSTAIFSA